MTTQFQLVIIMMIVIMKMMMMMMIIIIIIIIIISGVSGEKIMEFSLLNWSFNKI